MSSKVALPMGRWFASYALAALSVLAVAYLVLDGTVAGQSWSDQAYLGSALQPLHAQRFANEFLHWITPITVVGACLALVAIGSLRRLPVAGLVAALGLGVAAVFAEVLRAVLPHPDLATGYEALMGGKTYQTFPSGHATIAAATTMGLLLVAGRGWRAPVAIAGTMATALVANGTLAAHWHRPGDAIGGIALATAIQCVAAWTVVRRYGARNPSPASQARPWILPVGCASASVAVIGFYLSDVRLWRSELLPAGVHPAAFPAAIVLIALVAGGAILGYAWLMRNVDLRPQRQ